MDMGLTGRVAVVTAGSRGLGFASAKALAVEGASVVICAREPQHLDEAAAQLQTFAQSGACVETVALDVSAPDAAARLVGAARDRLDRLDVLVTNAGGPPQGSSARVGDAAWERAFQLTLMSFGRRGRRPARDRLRPADRGGRTRHPPWPRRPARGGEGANRVPGLGAGGQHHRRKHPDRRRVGAERTVMWRSTEAHCLFRYSSCGYLWAARRRAAATCG